MKHLDVSEVSMTYAGNGRTIDLSTTCITLPDPHHRYDVSMGDKHISFTTGEAFEALAKLLGVSE